MKTGRKKDEVASLLERLSNCDGAEAVSMDMSTTFREAVQLCLPRARIVADHFHVIQHVNIADTVMEYVVQPAQRTTRPAAWVGVLHRGIQLLKVALLCCQVLAWIGAF